MSIFACVCSASGRVRAPLIGSVLNSVLYSYKSCKDFINEEMFDRDSNCEKLFLQSTLNESRELRCFCENYLLFISEDSGVLFSLPCYLPIIRLNNETSFYEVYFIDCE